MKLLFFLRKSRKLLITDKYGRQWKWNGVRYEYVPHNRGSTTHVLHRRYIPVHKETVVTEQLSGKPRFADTEETATRWAAGSNTQQTMQHATAGESLKHIVLEGFTSKRRVWGKVWGNGIYLNSFAKQSENKTAVQFWSGGVIDPVVIRAKIKVKRTLELDGEELSKYRNKESSDFRLLILRQAGIDEQQYLDRVAAIDAAIADFRRPMQSTAERAERQRKLDHALWMAGVEDLAEADPKAKAFTDTLQQAGYDSIHIKAPEFAMSHGGDQYVVFDPKNVKAFAYEEVEGA